MEEHQVGIYNVVPYQAEVGWVGNSNGVGVCGTIQRKMSKWWWKSVLKWVIESISQF